MEVAIILTCYMSGCYCREDKFRMAFAEIGTLKSLIPPTVNIMALTATLSTLTYHVVIKKLAMTDPALIGIDPDRPNITLALKPYLKINELGYIISEELLSEKNKTPKSVVFCQSYTSCYQLYNYIRKKLKEYFTFPSGYPDIHKFRLVEMFQYGLCTCKCFDEFHKFSKYY